MADPTLGLTLTDFQIRVAEFLGIAYLGADGQGVAQVPVNAHDLDLVNRLVGDGYRRFVSENPKWNVLDVPFNLTFVPQFSGLATTGGTTTMVDASIAGVYGDGTFTGWGVKVTHAADSSFDYYVVSAYTGATGTFTFVSAGAKVIVVGDSYLTSQPPTVGGENYRYFMPDDFYGIVLSPWTYNTGGPRLSINTITESEIREMRAVSNASGTVSACAFRAINTTASTSGGRWEVLFWPAPASTNTVTVIYKRFPQMLMNPTDRSVFGFQHDGTILAAMIAEAERQRGDAIGAREQAYQEMLVKSLAIDARASTVRSKGFGDRSEDRAPFGRRPLSYYGVDTYGGVRIP